MKKPLRTQPEAVEELNHAAGWYEQRRAGLGLRFLASTDATLNQIRRLPEAGASVFPYHLIYLEAADAIHVLAFAHDKRQPSYWMSRTAAGGPSGADE